MILQSEEPTTLILTYLNLTDYNGSYSDILTSVYTQNGGNCNNYQ